MKKILDRKNFGEESEPWVHYRRKYFPFSLHVSFEITYQSRIKKSSEVIFSLIIRQVYVNKEACHETTRHSNKQVHL